MAAIYHHGKWIKFHPDDHEIWIIYDPHDHEIWNMDNPQYQGKIN